MMGNDLRRRQMRLTRQERIRRRKRQIRIRLIVIAIAILGLIFLIAVTYKGKKDLEVLGTEMEESQQQEDIVASEEESEDTEEQPETETEEETDGWTVIVDAGHGGKDQGCAYGEVLEKDINLDIALLLRDKLEAAGVNVVMTRADDTFVYLNRRVEAAENVEADVYVSIHVDSYSDDEAVNGLTIHYQEGADGGKVMAQTIHSVLDQENITNVRSIMESDLYVLRNTTMPATLIEVGFLTNRTDRTNLQSEAFLEDLSNGIYEGIIEYLEENEKN
jgi:N-acetylmuramoyl-L-alanine amidase